MWKIIILASFVIGISYSWELSEPQKTSLHQVAERICSRDNGRLSIFDYRYSWFRKSKSSQVEKSVNNFLDCYAQKIMPHYMNGVLSGLDTKNDSFTTRICIQVPDLTSCFYKLLDDMTICRNKDNEGEIKRSKKLLDKLFEGLCGVELVDDTDDSLQCLNDKSEDLKTCLNEMEFDTTDMSNPVANLKEKCAPYVDILKCQYSVLTECAKPATVDFIAEVIDLIWKSTPCNMHFRHSMPVNASQP